MQSQKKLSTAHLYSLQNLHTAGRNVGLGEILLLQFLTVISTFVRSDLKIWKFEDLKILQGCSLQYTFGVFKYCFLIALFFYKGLCNFRPWVEEVPHHQIFKSSNLQISSLSNHQIIKLICTFQDA